jgi:hypothetical protein
VAVFPIRHATRREGIPAARMWILFFLAQRTFIQGIATTGGK